MANTQVTSAVSEAFAPVANPMGFDLAAMGVDELLTTADTLGGSMYSVVRMAAIKAAGEPYELDAAKPATADARAKAVREVHRETLNKLSETNRANISSWFADFLVLHFAPLDASLELSAPKGNQGAVTTTPASAINMSKNNMRTAASRVRELEGTGRNRAPKVDAPKVDAQQPAEVAADVAFWAALKNKLGTPEGIIAMNKHLMALGFTLSELPKADPAAGIVKTNKRAK